jgi:hypothetical protein
MRLISLGVVQLRFTLADFPHSPGASGTNTAVSFSIVASPDASPTFAAGPAPDLYS